MDHLTPSEIAGGVATFVIVAYAFFAIVIYPTYKNRQNKRSEPDTEIQGYVDILLEQQSTIVQAILKNRPYSLLFNIATLINSHREENGKDPMGIATYTEIIDLLIDELLHRNKLIIYVADQYNEQEGSLNDEITRVLKETIELAQVYFYCDSDDLLRDSYRRAMLDESSS